MDLASPCRWQPNRAEYLPLELYIHVVMILCEGCQCQHLAALTTGQDQVRRIDLNRDYRVILLLPCRHFQFFLLLR